LSSLLIVYDVMLISILPPVPWKYKGCFLQRIAVQMHMMEAADAGIPVQIAISRQVS